MNSKHHKTPPSTDSKREPDDTPGTVQMLVADTGNRDVIKEMLDDYFDVETSQTIQDADLYLIEDHLFSEYHETLRERVEQAHPTFCPVVLIRRETTELTHPAEGTAFHEGPILIDDVVDAPIDRSLLIRRLHSLLVRHRQSRELSSHVSILEEREQELRRFERRVESTGNGIVMTDRLGEIDYVNPAVEEITGYPESEVLGETARILQPTGAADVFTEDFWQTMLNKNEWAGEVVIEHSDEARSVVDTSITAIHDEGGDVEGFVLFLNDITERIQQEQELQSREQELDLLRQILTRYLRHNLRNDLNVILGFGEMLATDETLSESQDQMAENIIQTAQRLLEKSDTARQFSTLLQQDTKLASYDFSAVVSECAKRISEQYPEVVFDIDVPDSCEIRARPGIRDAVEELIENAAKHNDAASPHVQIQLRDSNGARLRIEDNGPGISELELGTLEVGEETPLLHSQGVGLWLSKWIIESVNGQLSFDRVDSGTRVTVEFPSPERVGPRGLDIPTLKERDQRLQTVIDRMTNAIIEVNGGWEITFVDPRAEEILDVSAEAIRGKKFWDVFSDARNTQFETVYRDAMESRTSKHVENYYSGIDGWLSVYVYPEFDGGLSIYFQETTERYEQRQAVEQARSRMELALEVTDAAVWEWVPETNTVTVHPERHPVFDTEIQTGDEFIEGIHPDDRLRVQEALETAFDTGAPYDVEYRVQTGETVRWATDYGEIQSDEAGNSRMVGVARDITEQKQREQELAQTHELLERTERIAAVGGWELDTDTMDVFWSDSLYEILGVEHDMRPLLDDALDLYHGADREIVESAVETALDVGDRFDVEARIRRPDGEIRWLRIQGVPTMDDGEVVTLRGAVQDITERKEHERELRELEQFNRELVENAPVGLFRLDEQMRVIYENERAEEIMGIPEDEDESVAIEIDPRDLPSVGEEVGRDVFDRLETGETVSFELPFESFYGKKRYVTGQGVPLFDNGNFNGAILMVQDVTDQREREQLFEAIFNNTYTLTGVMDLDGTLQEANETALSFGGIDREDVVGKSIWDTYWFKENQHTRQTARKAVTHARKGELFRDEIQVQGEDDVMIIDFTVRPVFDEDGSVTFLIPEGRDITDLKEREQQLKAERRRFQSLVDVLPHGVYRADPVTLETTYANDAFERIHGSTGGEWRDNPDLWEQALHADDASTVKETFRAHRESRDPGQLEYRIQTGDGDTRWIEDTFRWEYDEAGNVTALVGVYTDITDRKEREREREELIRELEQSEEKLHLGLEAGEMGMWELDLQSEESPVRTPQHDRIFGYEPPVEHWSFDRFLEHVHLTDRERIEESFDEAFETGRLEFECRIARADGDLRWIAAEGEFFDDSDGTPDHAIGVVEDITERKEREHALEERVKELAAIQEAAHTFLRSDGALADSFEEFVETLPHSFQYPEIAAAKITYNEYESSTADFERREESLTAQRETETEGTIRIDVVYLEERPTEDDGPFLTEEQALLDTLVALIGSYVERWEYVQQLERKNEQLKTQTRQLDAILQHTTRPMFMKSADGTYLLVNREYQEQFGLTETEILGRTDFELHANEMAEEVWANDQKVLETGDPIEVEERILIEGEERLYLSSKVPIYFGDDRTEPDAVFGMATDITERTAQQVKLEQQNDQLEAFTSIVSHDLRNPLTVAQGRLELVQDECQSEHIDHIADAHHRIDTLIDDMLTLARYGDRVGETEPVMLSEVVESCWQTVDTAHAALVIETEQTISADESRLKQLFENLIRNSVEYGGSDVTVTVGELDSGFYVEDTGSGISEDVSDEVFNAGFSTNESGTGFGLSIVKEIVNAHGWNIHVTEESAGGARFEITGVEFEDRSTA